MQQYPTLSRKRKRGAQARQDDTTRTEGHVTLAEYFQTPETLLPQELIFGAVRVADAPFVPHQRLVLRLASALQDHVDETKAGEIFVAPIDCVLDRERALVLQPDIVFVSHSRRDIVLDRIYGAPDLAIEILSPRPRIGQLDERVAWFAQYGVAEVWLYDQSDARLHVLRCADGAVVSREAFEVDEPIRSAVLPQFRSTMQALGTGKW
jgi:Uma2 family endonuclease